MLPCLFEDILEPAHGQTNLSLPQVRQSIYHSLFRKRYYIDILGRKVKKLTYACTFFRRNICGLKAFRALQ
jgi:hypothetical protein